MEEILYSHTFRMQEDIFRIVTTAWFYGDGDDDNGGGGGEANTNKTPSLTHTHSLLMSKIEIYTFKCIHMRIGSFKSHIQRVLLPFSSCSISFSLTFLSPLRTLTK